ncbi:hypothetical protein BZA70DRAFT_112750 [Myxozyma melibiosi]|uniref:UBX domain-containing protein n=1 Tax=Myxozyma melibiosi TaxID=54550 RepID=A0ABR1FA43_9ASCO
MSETPTQDTSSATSNPATVPDTTTATSTSSPTPTQTAPGAVQDSSATGPGERKVAAYQSLLTNKSRKLTDGGPLLTKELRTKQELEKVKKIEKIEIRIKFPDQTQLMSTFKPNETIDDVMTFVRFSLVDPMIPFYFFITPPRRVLSDPSKKLVDDLKFAAREILYFSWDTQKIAEQLGEGYQVPAQPLRPEVLKAAQDISKLRTFEMEQQLQRDKEEEEAKKKGKAKAPTGTGSGGRTLGGGSGGKLTKPPAWMKLGKR